MLGKDYSAFQKGQLCGSPATSMRPNIQHLGIRTYSLALALLFQQFPPVSTYINLYLLTENMIALN